MIQKKIIFSQTICTPFFRYYLARQDMTPIHLTLAAQRHHQALAFLEKSFTIVDAPATTCDRADLATLLRGGHSFDEYRDTPFIVQATPMQRHVWRLLCDIAHGATTTYGELATMLGNKHLARAVGQACGANPIALFIPCHRVVATNGIGGFTGGAAIKRQLLEMERQHAGSGR